MNKEREQGKGCKKNGISLQEKKEGKEKG